MRRRSRRKIPKDPVSLSIESLSHDGRGIGRIDGKTVFVDGALPGESIEFVYTDRKRNFDEGRVVELHNSSPVRQETPCEHALICGGCSLQHLQDAEQIKVKEQTLLEQFQHFGDVEAEQQLAPMLGPTLGYRRKARLAVKNVPKKGGVLVGFREKRNSFVTDIESCPVLDERVGSWIPALKSLIGGLECCASLPQIEVAAGDEEVAFVFRHLQPLSTSDEEKLRAFCEENQIHGYLQPKGPTTVHRIHPKEGVERLHYRLEEFGLEFAFHPMDFTQVNADINRQMVSRAISLLELKETDRVLDLFCGLGNFTLPIATKAATVVGVEGSEAMVERGYENAKRNGLENVQFYAADLTEDNSAKPWAEAGFDKILLDPPRSGAVEMMPLLDKYQAQRIVYVSCNPATLARDAGELKKLGYRMLQAGVMDMFPHTTHVESIAVFEK